MKKVKVAIEYEWEIDEREWKGLQDWDESSLQAGVKDRLEYDPVSSFYSLSQIKVPTPIRVKVDKVPD